MALPTSGAISLANVNTELGVASNTTRSLNDAAVRSLFGKASGVISMSDGYGKSSLWKGTISSNQLQLNLRQWAIANGWNGTAAAEITIAPGVYVYSDNTAAAALVIDGSWPAGIALVNNGYIMGKGGKGGGGAGYGDYTLVAPGAGGPAISLWTPVSISGNGYICGGGGGGATYSNERGGGGGQGGGQGGDASMQGYNPQTGTPSDPWFAAGGAGGAVGAAGSNGTYNGNTSWLMVAVSGGGGGRVVPGSATAGHNTSTTGYSLIVLPGRGGTGGGTGATQGSSSKGEVIYIRSGGGGAAGQAGENGDGLYMISLGGGGFGAQGGSAIANATYGTAGVAGGLGGKAVNLNGLSITWVGGFPSSRVFGAVS